MRKLITMILVLILTISVLPKSLSAQENIIEQFMELQDKVTAVLEIDNNHYVYSEEEIIKVIKNEHFDFEALNKELGSNYTEDSFTEIALYNIKNTNLEIRYTDGSCIVQSKGTYCGRNADASGWNYDRYFRDEEQTQDWIDGSRELSSGFDGIATPSSIIMTMLPGIGGTIVGVIATGTTIGATYYKLLADSLEYNNELGNCGTVTDMNRFTGVFTIWSQDDFVE